MANTQPRAGERKYGRSQLGNGCHFDKRLNAGTRRGRRLRDLMATYAETVGRELTPFETDIARSLSITQVEIDTLEHQDQPSFAKLKLAYDARDKLSRRLGLLAADFHHPDFMTAGAAEGVSDAEG
jgi:hypothetical protein